jgi:hypothetical protein
LKPNLGQYLLISIAVMACSVLVGCGDSTVHAQQAATAAILTGYCDASDLGTAPATAFLTGLGGGTTCENLNGTNNTGVPMPSAGTLQNLHALSLRGATVTVIVNGTSSTMSCTVPATGTLPGSCSDTTHSVQVAAGDLVAVEATQATSAQIQGVQVSLEKQ